MWAEARKHEKKLRGLMVDYRRRAERRREFYHRIRSDPAAFLQIHGNQMKVHIDPNLCSAAESSLMPWMGDSSNLIDRFDVRAHLDRLDIVNNTSNITETVPNSAADEILERQINYERYRNLVQNEFLGLNETKFLQQIWFEERFGVNQKECPNKSNVKKKLAEKKATISYNYDNEDSTSQTIHSKNSESSESEESSDEDYDFDTTVNIDQLDNDSGHRINSIAIKYGMKSDDFVKYLDEDKTEAEKIRLQKEIENEKSMFTGRKSRRERRALKEQRLLILRAANVEDSDKMGPKKSEPEKQTQSSSDSEVSVDETKIEFITSFGGSSEEEGPKESEEKKQKQVVTKRKQKVKALNNQKIEAIPIVYGPTLPGEDSVPNVLNTSFNKSSHSKQRTYRFNDTIKRSRTRSRSHSFDRFKYRRNERHYPRRTRSRSRSPDLKRSSNRTPDRYRNRRRSKSRERIRRRTRSRTRSQSRDRRRRSRSRERTRRKRSPTPRRRSRSLSRNRRSSRRRSRSKNRRDKSHSRRSRSIKRSRSKEKNREHRDRQKSSPKRSRSKSQNQITVQKDNNSEDNKQIVLIDKSVKNIVEPIKTEQIVTETQIKVDPNSEPNIERPKTITVAVKEEKCEKAPSPPVRSYYRHDLCESDGSDEELRQKHNQTEKDEGTKTKRTSNVSNVKSGYKSSISSSSMTITPQERLKKKRQALIDKQYKLDKKAELQKLEKQQQEREDREEELREMTSKLRHRRDLYREHKSSRSTSRSRSVSSSNSSSSSY